jgi:nucleoid DNA-binding protein
MATKPMTKGQIVDHLSKKVGTTKKAANQFLDELVGLSYREAKKDFTIPTRPQAKLWLSLQRKF